MKFRISFAFLSLLLLASGSLLGQSAPQEASTSPKWELGARLIPSLQRIGIPGQSQMAGIHDRYATGAGFAVSFQPWKRIYATAGIRFLDAGAISRANHATLPLAADTLDFVSYQPSYLNLTFGAGLAFPLGKSLDLRMELQGMVGPKVREQWRTVYLGDTPPEMVNGAGFEKWYTGISVSAGIRAQIHPRVQLEFMPTLERQIKSSWRNVSPLMQGTGIQVGAFYQF
jgi:hypothetical protein